MAGIWQNCNKNQTRHDVEWFYKYHALLLLTNEVKDILYINKHFTILPY